ncbi:hypothetical protein [Ideonella sp.]|uniref:hypothetical protein n=1 Tax=Ideonella sp. TaxID=1929293 RepID=UPI002E356D2D|nr:hypothetical protein [Ideonella sp.]
MARYVFHLPLSLDSKAVSAAKRKATALGATVVRTAAGQMLVETTPSKAARVAEALPDWRYALERVAARLPEKSPLSRAKYAAAR